MSDKRLLSSKVSNSSDSFTLHSYEQKKKWSGSNEIATFFNFAKASIGSGSFALPWALAQSGLIVGSAGLVLLGIISAYTMHLILQCKQYATKNLSPEEKRNFTFTDVGRSAGGVIGKWSVDFSVILCNVGVCAGYIVFIASNLQWAMSCLPVFTVGSKATITLPEVYAYLIPILILITFLPSFKYLAYFAYVGMVFLVVAMVTVYIYPAVSTPNQGFEGIPISADNMYSVSYYEWKTLPQFFGAAAFLFCVHTMVVPLESSMSRPGNMQYVIDAAALIVVVVNLPFAIYAYLLFGNAVRGYCFENLTGLFPDIVRLTLAFELTLTFPIVIKPPSDVIEEIGILIYNWAHNESGYVNIDKQYKRCPTQCKNFVCFISKPYTKTKGRLRTVVRFCLVCLMRAILVLLAFTLAALIPRFELVISLVGGLATTIAAFILPPLFHILLFRKIKPKYMSIFNAVVFVFGVAAAIITTVTTIIQAVKPPSSNSTAIICNGTVF